MSNSTPIHRHTTPEEEFVTAIMQLAEKWDARFISSDSTNNEKD